jgi:tRNA A-37 threonylcarbamoyl transferase component Bud32
MYYFVDHCLSFLSWPLCCLTFNLRILITSLVSSNFFIYSQEEFEDTKGVIGIRISKMYRQHNGHNKKYKRTNNDLQNTHKTKDWLTWTPPIDIFTHTLNNILYYTVILRQNRQYVHPSRARNILGVVLDRYSSVRCNLDTHSHNRPPPPSTR